MKAQETQETKAKLLRVVFRLTFYFTALRTTKVVKNAGLGVGR